MSVARATPSASAGRRADAEPRVPARRAADWIADSPLLAQACALAEGAHRSQNRSTDGRPFLDHVTDVAGLLRGAGFDQELIAVGLLHDSVERGTLTEPQLREEMGDEIASLVMTLSEDPTVQPFAARKAALRRRVAEGGVRAVTVFAADKLSDIRGLRSGIAIFGDSIEQRMDSDVGALVHHYRMSVELIEAVDPACVFLPALRLQLTRLPQRQS